jgi:uncharacterized membrane protein
VAIEWPGVPVTGRLDLVGARTAVAAVTGLLAGGLLAVAVPWEVALLGGWVIAATVNLTWTWSRVIGLDADGTQRHASTEDPSQRLSETLVIVAGVALLAAVSLLLVRAGGAHGGTKAYLITVGVLSVFASWAMVHTVFMLRYARSYYRGGAGASTSTNRRHRRTPTSPISPSPSV